MIISDLIDVNYAYLNQYTDISEQAMKVKAIVKSVMAIYLELLGHRPLDHTSNGKEVGISRIGFATAQILRYTVSPQQKQELGQKWYERC